MFYAPLPRTLAAALRDVRDAKSAVREAALTDLGRYAETEREQIVSPILRALDDEHPRVRARAAELLGDHGILEAVPRLLLLIEDDDPLVRQNAIASLGLLGDSRAEPRLVRALGDRRQDVRFQAVIAFARITRDAASLDEALVKAVSDDDPAIAHIALRMAEEVAEREARPISEPVLAAAARSLNHRDPRVRVVSALLVLSSSHSGESTPIAKQVAIDVATGKHPCPEVDDHGAVLLAVGRLRFEEAFSVLERRAFPRLLGLRRDPFEWHARVALALGGHHRAIQAILADLSHRDPRLRLAAAEGAMRAGIVAAIPILEAQAPSSDAEREARSEVLAALLKIRDASASQGS